VTGTIALAHDDPVRRDLPTGTVTFLFTDVEGSTKLLHELGSEGYAAALTGHRLVIREACSRQGGVEVDTQGDAFFFVFPTAPGALSAAEELTEKLASGRVHVRIGLHTGTPLLTAEGYVGVDVHRAARIAACGHGGQILVSSSTAQLVGIELRDLGEHRLKDLSASERIYQLGDGEFPPLKSLYRTNLPIPATPFLGREGELAEVRSLLAREDTRLLTLTGPGGTGKTRLSLQAAAEASDSFPDGIWWVPLAPLRDPRLVLETAAQALGAKNSLAEHIASKRLLLLFDNFEQVVEAATDVAGLLASCPDLNILVTSRERLRVSGEQTYSVPPLAEGDGVALFTARARAVDPAFAESEAVGELCVRLDELPLALELAAARTTLFSPAQLLERLSQRLDFLKGARDADPRQQTLRATIGWSHDLLSEEERTLFARLSVFAGGCSYAATEQVAGADPELLQSLLDKSLLRKLGSELEQRYWMLETIREYAAEQLEAFGEADEISRRHAAHYLALAEEALPSLRGNPKEWLDRLQAEHDNFRAALDWLEASDQTQQALELAGALSRFWYLRGHLAEGRRLLDGLLRADERPTSARARALLGAAVMLGSGEDLALGRVRAEEALTLNRTLGDAWGAAYSVFMLGMIATEESDWARALPLFEESQGAFRELGDEHYTLLATDGLAWMYGNLGDLERRRALHEDVLHRARALSDESVIAVQLDQLWMFARDEGRSEDAGEMLKESLRINHDHDRPGGIVENLSHFADFLAARGRAVMAARLLSRAEVLSEEIGGVPAWVEEINEETLVVLRTQLDAASFAEAWEQGRAMTVDEAVALALDS
jgi:predicted ATPase/class 3 adenylate cyclase